MKLLITMIQGFCMAIADSVPGVSGGTIAFIFGFYDKFIFSLHHIFRGNSRDRKTAALFLGKLMIGWMLGFGTSVLVLESIFETHIYELCSLFLGLSIFALPIIISQERKALKENYKNLIFTAMGIAAVSLITYFISGNESTRTVDITHLSMGNILYVFFAAMLAISAMVLPGISGSTLLLIFGLYVPIIGAIKEFMKFNFTYVPILFVFGLGVLIGITTMVQLVKSSLEKYRSQTIYLILGLLTGSLYAIVMGPTTLDMPREAMTLSTFHLLYFLTGLVILFALWMLREASGRR